MIKIGDIESIKCEPASEIHEGINAYDNTRLVAINTCPVWGAVRYGLGLAMPSRSRAMALEAGSACHEVFAAARLWNVYKQGLTDHYHHHGHRLFGVDRFAVMESILAKFLGDDNRTQMLNFCLEALYTSGFYDDPMDTRRTMTNLEEACIVYLDRVRWKRPVWVADKQDPTAMVGIEIPFNLVITYTMTSGELFIFRFIGRIDGVHWDGERIERAGAPSLIGRRIELEENKTAWRLDDAWKQAFLMSHQITGYLVAAQTLLGESMSTAVVHGLAIPQPRSRDIGGIERIPIMRYEHQFKEWFFWFLKSALTYEDARGQETNIEKYTHSCNRYFRPCSFIPLCYAPPDERQDILGEMVEDVWNPLHEGSDD